MSTFVEPRGWRATRLRIIARDGGICALCGRPGADTADHIIPRAYGGGHEDSNLRAAHMRCNSARGGRMNAGRRRVRIVRRKVVRRWGEA